MDLRNKATLTTPERWLIASDIQAILLDEIFAETEWTARDGIFHGGTGLHLAHDSPRLSEDLDFMIAEPALDALEGAAGARIVDRTRMRVEGMLPGSALDFKSRDRGPGPDRLVTWDLRWRHPNRMGKVMVKLEFYATAPEALADYASYAEMRLPGLRRVKLRVEIPVPHLRSAWADKVKAISTRPEFKWRDAFDLGWISREFSRPGVRPSDVDLGEALRASARIYGKTPGELVEGLELRLADGTFGKLDEFVENMTLWFETDTHAAFVRNGTLEACLRSCETEVGSALVLVRSTIPGLRA